MRPSNPTCSWGTVVNPGGGCKLPSALKLGGFFLISGQSPRGEWEKPDKDRPYWAVHTTVEVKKNMCAFISIWYFRLYLHMIYSIYFMTGSKWGARLDNSGFRRVTDNIRKKEQSIRRKVCPRGGSTGKGVSPSILRIYSRKKEPTSQLWQHVRVLWHV